VRGLLTQKKNILWQVKRHIGTKKNNRKLILILEKKKKPDKHTLWQCHMVYVRNYNNNIHHVDDMKKVYQHKYVLHDNHD
jgi:hypothetical protein